MKFYAVIIDKVLLDPALLVCWQRNYPYFSKLFKQSAEAGC